MTVEKASIMARPERISMNGWWDDGMMEANDADADVVNRDILVTKGVLLTVYIRMRLDACVDM